MEPPTPDLGSAGKGASQRPRRPRAARACDNCRSKKNKCDELYPCTFCKVRNLECFYKGQDPSRRRFAPDYVRQLEDQVKELSEKLDSAQVRGEPTARVSAEPSLEVQPPPQAQHLHQNFEPPAYPDAIPTPNSTTSRPEQEVSGVNRHTRSVEFYGSSSSVAILSHVQRSGEQTEDDPASLVSSLHNPVFRDASNRNGSSDDGGGGGGGSGSGADRRLNYYPQCRSFLDCYFTTIHYVHPILDRKTFMDRCEQQLWARNGEPARITSFTALYYGVMSLGALVGMRDDEPTDGMDNLTWSRKFFGEARRCCNALCMVTDLEMVQCYFMLAKVCQNELNPHWSYLYVGLAVRTALAMGINREPGPNTAKTPAQIRAESRTWWGLYSLETEMSFAMGRPDTLGADAYHNRRLPCVRDAADTPASTTTTATTTTTTNATAADADADGLDPPHCAIIRHMVDFSRITRSVCQGIYMHSNGIQRRIALAGQIELDLEQWVDGLPEQIRPDRFAGAARTSLRSAKAAQWAKRQKLVLAMRYHNLRILLFGSFLLASSPSERAAIPASYQGVQMCLDSAKETIELIYRTYQHNDYFRTWFYNTTYTVFAASIILVYIAQEASDAEMPTLLQFIDMAIEILEIMDECVVALEAAKLLRRAKDKAQQRRPLSAAGLVADPAAAPRLDGSTVHLNHYWGPLNLLDGDMDLDFSFGIPNFEGEANALFMDLDGNHSSV